MWSWHLIWIQMQDGNCPRTFQRHGHLNFPNRRRMASTEQFWKQRQANGAAIDVWLLNRWNETKATFRFSAMHIFSHIRNPGDGAGGLTSRQKEGGEAGGGVGVGAGVGGRGFASRSTPALAKPLPASSQVVFLALLETRYNRKEALRLLILNLGPKTCHLKIRPKNLTQCKWEHPTPHTPREGFSGNEGPESLAVNICPPICFILACQSVCFGVCVSFGLSVYLSFSLCVYLSVRVSICFFVFNVPAFPQS